MGRRSWIAVAAATATAGCLSIPDAPGTADAAPDARACTPGVPDCDGDGWPAMTMNPLAADCDDTNPDINPGAIDDVGDAVDEDCSGSPETMPTIDGAFWAGDALVSRSGTRDVALGFATDLRMPSQLTIDAINLLRFDGAPCDTPAEEAIGVTLYPAFAADADPSAVMGNVTPERDGPAMATVLVAWTVMIDDTGLAMCNAPTTLAATIRFTALPGGRIVRDDQINVSTPVSTCTGCSITSNPFFTSYVSLDDMMFDQFAMDHAPPMALPVSDLTLAPINSHEICMSQSQGGAQPTVGFSWYFPTDGTPTGPSAGLRVRASGALVTDWRRGTAVDSGNYEAITTMVGDVHQTGCADATWETLDEIANPVVGTGLTFNHRLGVYEADAATDNFVQFMPLDDINHGMAIRVTGLGTHGVTVWSAGTRIFAGPDYLVQLDADGAYIVWLPSALGGRELTIAGPGGEPSGA